MVFRRTQIVCSWHLRLLDQTEHLVTTQGTQCGRSPSTTFSFHRGRPDVRVEQNLGWKGCYSRDRNWEYKTRLGPTEQYLSQIGAGNRGGSESPVYTLSRTRIPKCSQRHRRMAKVHQRDNGKLQAMEERYYCIHSKPQQDSQRDQEWRCAQTQERQRAQWWCPQGARPGSDSSGRKAREAASQCTVCVQMCMYVLQIRPPPREMSINVQTWMCRHIHLNMTRSYSPDVDRHPTGGSMFVIGRNLQCNPLVRTRTVNNIKEVQCVDWQQRLSKDICFASFNTQQGVNKSPRTQHRSNQVSDLVAAIQRQRTRSAAAGQVRNAHE